MEPFPDEHEVIAFFECEPTLTDDNIPWAYNCLSFESERGNDLIRCQIEPGDETVKFSWFRDGIEHICLDLHRVTGMKMSFEQGRDLMTLTFPLSSSLLPLQILLKPTISIRWGISE